MGQTIYAASDSATIPPKLADFKTTLKEVYFDDKHPHLWISDGSETKCMENYYHNSPQEYDPVNHPKHYTSGGYECIDAMYMIFGESMVWNFCLGNVFKYLWRRKDKGNEEQDVQKALWYFDKFKEMLNVEHGN